MSAKSSSILVTGGAGYIGSHACRQLLAEGHKVVVLDDLSTGWEWAVPRDAIFVRGSVADAPLVCALFRQHGVDSVMHFAGCARVDESVRDPLKYYENNSVASQTLIRACLAAGVNRFVFSSTAAVYGTPRSLPVSEDAPTTPVSPYGRSKLATEWVLSDLQSRALPHGRAPSDGGFRFVTLRYFNVAGARPDGTIGQASPEATHLIKVACQAACGTRDGVSVFGSDYPTKDGTGVRDYVHVEDIASAHLHALQYLSDGGPSRVFNCGYGHGFSVREVLSAVREISGVDFPVRESGRRAGDSAELVADASRIRRELGWKPRYDDLMRICETAFRWEKALSARQGEPPTRSGEGDWRVPSQQGAQLLPLG